MYVLLNKYLLPGTVYILLIVKYLIGVGTVKQNRQPNLTYLPT